MDNSKIAHPLIFNSIEIEVTNRNGRKSKDIEGMEGYDKWKEIEGMEGYDKWKEIEGMERNGNTCTIRKNSKRNKIYSSRTIQYT